jgi:hypothetical protein
MTAQPMDTTDTSGDLAVSEAVLAFKGRVFRVAHSFGLMPLLRFAHMAKGGMNVDDMDALVAIYDVLRQAIHDDDWDAFQQYATDTRADADELLSMVKDAIGVMTQRPTVRPTDSSAGPSTTTPSSSADSSSPASSDPTTLAERARHLQPVADLISGGSGVVGR